MGREVILNSNTLEDSIDQYDSMVKEKALADPNRADPRWMNVFPSSELPAWKRQWPVVPSFTYGGINYGTIVKTAASAVLAVVSLDATDPARLDRLVGEGRMPNLAALRERGHAQRGGGAAAAGADGAGHVLHAGDGRARRDHGRCLPFVWDPAPCGCAGREPPRLPALWDRMGARRPAQPGDRRVRDTRARADRGRVHPRAPAPQPRIGSARGRPGSWGARCGGRLGGRPCSTRSMGARARAGCGGSERACCAERSSPRRRWSSCCRGWSPTCCGSR